MPKKRGGRDPKFSHTIGEKPHVGRRYVENGRVRIEWSEGGTRRRRSFGENSPEARSEADAALEEILDKERRNTENVRRPDQDEESTGQPKPVTAEALARSLVLSLMDTADRVAEWIRPEQ